MRDAGESAAPSPAARPYAGRRIALLTQHGKEALAQPLVDALGCTIERVTGFDTDTLGSFTREVPRTLGALDAAREKARLACALHGTSLGMGSEGSFGLDPALAILPWSFEVVVLYDAARGIDVAGRAAGHACWAHGTVDSWASAVEFARRLRFPEHWLVLRPSRDNDPRIVKDIADWDTLRTAFHLVREEAADGQVSFEVDGRAHANPTRQVVIRAAMRDLAGRLLCACPVCGTPGFGRERAVAGLPCGGCGAPTPQLRAQVWACVRCRWSEERAVADAYADPGQCVVCNP